MVPSPPEIANYATDKSRFLRFLDSDSIQQNGERESIRMTPLFSLAVKYSEEVRHIKTLELSNGVRGTSASQKTPAVEADIPSNSTKRATKNGNIPKLQRTTSLLPQYGLLGFSIGATPGIDSHEPIMFNTHAPNSVFICRSQGGGKSYTFSCILENCLLSDQYFGNLEQPLTGLLFHYDPDSSGTVAEAVHLASRGVQVNVLASGSNFDAIHNRYRMVTKGSTNVRVNRFLLAPSELSIERMYRLMAFSDKSGSVPLYMEDIQMILRQMAVSGQGRAFDYGECLRLLEAAKLTNDQQRPMRLRLDLLHSFMRWPPTKTGLKSKTPERLLDLKPGTLTIVDLSDPFIDDATACMLFDISLSIAKERRPNCGLIIALDEAHKYMNRSSAATNFTDRLLTTIREQRHIGTRVVVATQEPTISEKLLDLCSVTIVHHFKSPAWFQAIRGHLGGASSLLNGSEHQAALFESILRLAVGESRVFAPTAFVCMQDGNRPVRLGSEVLHMKTRSRLGMDGGCSIMAEGENGTARALPDGGGVRL